MKGRERNTLIFLSDMIDMINRIERFTGGFRYEDFCSDEKTFYATIQCIEIIGEAAKHIPKQIRTRYPSIPWIDVAGMRDKLIHSYFGIDPLKVWKVIAEDIPDIKPQLEQAVADLKKGH
jgi:uncharacterized protein with HEPN domain